MRLLIVIMSIFLVIFHYVYGSGCCTCICCRGMNCSPVKQSPFDTDSCDIDNKCNYPCCQRYPEVCFPLPGPGVVDSICQNSIICNS
jgi:hypothetical protein